MSSSKGESSKRGDEPKVTPEGQRKGDDIIRRMVNTPPKPHKPVKKERGQDGHDKGR